MEPSSVYRDLTELEVRFMSLLPGKFGSVLKCDLFPARLDSRTDYEALSYVWGPVSDEHNELLVCTETFTITWNLFIALQYIRHPTEVVTLWVDAICINQKNYAERGSQVLLMRQIYEGARQVISWLGLKPSAELEMIHDLLKEFDVQNEDKMGHVRVVESAFNPAHLPKWRSFLSLMTNGYWKRRWIIQEVVCAKKMILKCGHDVFSWPEINIIANMIHNNQKLVFNIFELRKAGINKIYTVHWLRELQWGWSDGRRGLPLYQLMKIAFHHPCTDPRDKIYALLGILDGKMELDINYALPPQHAFMEATRMIIGQLKRLEVICDSWSQKQPEGYPSWCPDWSQPIKVMSFRAVGAVYKADAISESQAVFSTDGKILSCKGCSIGAVAKVGESYWEHGLYENPFTEVKKNHILTWLDLALQDPPQDLDEENWKNTRIESFWRAMVGGTEHQDADLNPAFYRHLFDVARGADLMSHDHSKYSLNAKDEAYQRLTSKFQENSKLTEEEQFQRYIAPFTTKTVPIMMNRVFFSAGPTIMGVAPHTTNLGDRICVLYGCQWPVILRQIGKNHVFIGAAYVEGFMSGEAMKRIEEGLLSVEEFHLE